MPRVDPAGYTDKLSDVAGERAGFGIASYSRVLDKIQPGRIPQLREADRRIGLVVVVRIYQYEGAAVDPSERVDSAEPSCKARVVALCIAGMLFCFGAQRCAQAGLLCKVYLIPENPCSKA